MLTEAQDREIDDMVTAGIEEKKYSFYFMAIGIAAIFAAFWAIDRNMIASIGLYILHLIAFIVSIRLNHTGGKKLNEAHRLYHEYIDINKARK